MLPPSCVRKTDDPTVTQADSTCSLWLGGPIPNKPPGKERCNRVLQSTANSYPRTCAVCGITGPCQYPSTIDKTIAQHRPEHGAEFPYDGKDQKGSEIHPAIPATDWAHAAARGVLADLCDRRGIKWELAKVDEETRIELTASMAEIIRLAEATKANKK